MSRKWPLVVGHAFLAAGMVMTGLVTAFPLLVVTQVLWGIGWGFSSGADVAWITDELAQPGRTARVLTARARWDSTGSAAGMAAFGALGWAAGLGAATVASGVGIALVGGFVAARFAEDNFTPVRGPRWGASLGILRRGAALARGDREILLMFAATTLINAASMVTWVFPKQLIDRVSPATRCSGTPRWGSRRSCSALARCAWSRRTSSEVRATVHSFLSQAECVGEIASGSPLAALAGAAGIPAALFAAAVITASAGAAVARSRSRYPQQEPHSAAA